MLAQKGVLGRFAIDFLSVKQGEEWQHFAIEINLRKGGTTHPFMMLEFLTNGHYDPGTGLFLTPTGQPCYRGGSASLNRIQVIAEWMSVLFMPRPGLAAAG